jgi:transposase InsO family protein
MTDNGAVYTSRFTHGHNDFERLLAGLGVTQKNGHPGHPRTQGKICEDLDVMLYRLGLTPAKV